MHRPRHTSELYADPDKKRQQLRSKPISTVAPPASGFTTRQSRLAVQSRLAPLDRAEGGYSKTNLSVPIPKLQGLTPRKTKLSKKKKASRILLATATHCTGTGHPAGNEPIAVQIRQSPLDRAKGGCSKANLSVRIPKQRGLTTRKTKLSKKKSANRVLLTAETHCTGSGNPAGTGPIAVLSRPPPLDRAEGGNSKADLSVPMPKQRGLTTKKTKLSKKKSTNCVLLTAETHCAVSGNPAGTGPIALLKRPPLLDKPEGGYSKAHLSVPMPKQRGLTTKKTKLSKKNSANHVLLTPETHCTGSGNPAGTGPIALLNRPAPLDRAEGGYSKANLSVPMPKQRGLTTQTTALSKKKNSNSVLFTAATHCTGSGHPADAGPTAVLNRLALLDKAEGRYSKAHLSVYMPQKTKLSKKKNANRVQFASETHCTVSGNPAGNRPMHIDNKWVHEQSQRIEEYLLKFPIISGISTSFLNRGLLQMSIKEFIAIVNFFLSFVCGNRYVVGRNYVDDIIQILQKLKYPHAANKTWDNVEDVIALLDYFMDFVSPSSKEDVAVDFFEIRKSHKVNISRAVDYMITIRQFQFQYQMLRNSEEGFVLWDNYMDDEFKHLQKATSDTLIQKICKFSSAEAIEREIYKLQKTRKALEDKTPIQNTQLAKNAILEKTKKLQYLRAENARYRKIYQRNKPVLKRLNKNISELSVKVDEQEKQIKLQMRKKQQLDQLITEKRHIMKMCSAQAIAIHNFEESCNRNLILYGRFLRCFTEQAELFNDYVREIAECRKMPSIDFQISLQPDVAQLEKLIPLLHHTKDMMEKSIRENENNICKLKNRTREIVNETELKLEPQLNALRSSASRWKYLLQQTNDENAIINTKIQNLQKKLASTSIRIAQQQQLIAWRHAEIDYIKETNELTMLDAEENHRRWMAQKWAAFEAYVQLVKAKQLQQQEENFED